VDDKETTGLAGRARSAAAAAGKTTGKTAVAAGLFRWS